MADKRIKVFIADDHAIVREGIRQLVGAQQDMEVVGEAGDGLEALEAAKTLRPDVMLLDIAMPGVSGLEAVSLIKDAVPGCQVVVLTMHSKDTFVHRVLDSGALGYVLKASPTEDVIKAIHAARQGEYFLSSKIKAEVVNAYLDSRKQAPAVKGYDLLSEREQQVFRLVAEGNSTNQIADVLCVSPKTVEKHRTNIMKKLGLKDRLELVKMAIRIGILDPQLWDN
ncbi:MAG: response regulator transcription factor [Desulfarculaceae bacterium]|nr:response regulator transcription factor [Desulfarculaceae bacterium]MCF8071616.1 response regulator transcription factor [Desulfarculaceae bacterium]MCF8103187.1 response regulator transcription factor [Desulfarculaceae bacterium]MCF8114895.1 response regulator transcription factor [Desulfarculaceae bacterium]